MNLRGSSSISTTRPSQAIERLERLGGGGGGEGPAAAAAAAGQPFFMGVGLHKPHVPVRDPSQHGLSCKNMTLITSDCGATRSVSSKWP